MPAVGAVRSALEAEDYDAARVRASSSRRGKRRVAHARRAAIGRARAPGGRGGHLAGGVLARGDVEAHRSDRGRAVREHPRGVRRFSSPSSQSAAGRRTSGPAEVASVLKGTPAAKAGLQPGDRIVAVNGRAATFDSVSQQIEASHGRPVTLTVLRDGRRVTSARDARSRSTAHWRFGFAAETLVVPYSTGHAARARRLEPLERRHQYRRAALPACSRVRGAVSSRAPSGSSRSRNSNSRPAGATIS